MLIILEGPDGAGKSFLADKLTKRIAFHRHGDVERFHAKPPTQHPLDEYETPLLSYRPGTDRNIICDRWHLGEYVYPKVFNRKTFYDDAVHSHIEMFLASRGAVVVLLYNSVTEMQRHVNPQRDAFVRPEHIPTLMRHYIQICNKPSPVSTIFWKTTRVDVDSIIGIALNQQRFASRLNNFVTYIGSPNPDQLILGEHRGNDRETLRPVFMPYHGTSGHYLFRSMSRIAPTWSKTIGVANACDIDDIDKLRNTLGNPQTVTLGVAATRRTRHRFASAPHPQFIRRFHNSSGLAYASVISTALNEETDLLRWRPSSLLSRAIKTTRPSSTRL